MGISDFKSIYKVLKSIDGVAFFNSGPNAGASQKHRHIQMLRKKSV
jgi:ATP adenylyltransferase